MNVSNFCLSNTLSPTNLLTICSCVIIVPIPINVVMSVFQKGYKEKDMERAHVPYVMLYEY